MAGEPRSVDELNTEYLSGVAAKLLGDPDVEVTSFKVIDDPFEFPRFGAKEFYLVNFDYQGGSGPGASSLVLRVMPRMDAVMMLTGDTQHRELQAFKAGLFDQIPSTFHTPYVDVVYRPERDQYWAWLEDVRPDMERLGMHAELPDETMRTILSHLAAFHAKFWQKEEVIGQPWLMSLSQPVDYFYRVVVDILDGMKDPAESSVYVTNAWPWLAEGVINMMNGLGEGARSAVESIYREPQGLLDAIKDMPQTLCHYDFDNRNLGIRRSDNGDITTVIDWEILGRGLSSSDVNRFLVYQQRANSGELLDYYLDELEARLGRGINRDEWKVGCEVASIAEWQIRGVLFPAMVAAPSSPIPDDQRPMMAERARADIDGIVDLVHKHRLA